MTSLRRRALALIAATALLVWAIVGLVRRSTTLRAVVGREVPAAASLFEAQRAGFEGDPGGRFQTRTASGTRIPTTLIAMAPAAASDAFELHERGGNRAAAVRLAGATKSKAVLEGGAVVYRGVYPKTDVIAFAGVDALELVYFSQVLPSPGALALTVTRADGDSFGEEASTRALLQRDGHHRPKLRLAEPLAIDASGTRRVGRYEVAGNDVRMVFNWTGMRPPVVIDPTIVLPFWSILEDARVPGSTVYNPAHLSRESHVAFDSVRDRTILVRPVRPELDDDTTIMLGNASNQPSYGGGGILPQARTHATAPFPSPSATADFERGYDLESETWEWNGTAWSIVDAARLPGLIDPALAFDAARARAVLYGGARSSGLNCGRQSGNANNITCATDLRDATATYEYDGTSWTTLRLPYSPPQRLRAAMAWSASSKETLMFGGQSFGLPLTTQSVNPEQPPYPESQTQGLLNDTWLYDGESWRGVPTGSPPPPMEGAQLVYDVGRKMFVLVGGHTSDEVAPNIDRLGIWEFDGVDWTQKLAPADATQPVSISTRYGVSTFYNPLRQRVTVFGGNVAKLDFCTMSDADIATQLTATASDPTGRQALEATGCLGGYVHDAWEWDGSHLTKVTDVAFGGVAGQTPVFEQVAGAAAWSVSAAPNGDAGGPVLNGPTALLSYRYDDRPTHFEPRTELERAHYPDGGIAEIGAPAAGVEVNANGAKASPLFGARVHPDVIFDTSRGVATVFAPDTGSIYDTDGSTWHDRTPARTPYSNGANDFLGTTWDTVNQRVIAFDPRDGTTWAYTDATGWSSLATTGPGPWTVDPTIHSKQDFFRANPDRSEGTWAGLFTSVLQQLPAMTFDRTRGRVVMLFAHSTWEFDGASWTSHPAPPTWTQCGAGTLVSYDGTRNRTVAFGCNVPADTWQWDGATWTGPGPSPYTAAILRNQVGVVSPETQINGNQLQNWFGTLQLAWSHPNAAFESSTLGGISTLDADGTVRTWNGSAWVAGPQVASQSSCISTVFDPTVAGTAATSSLQSYPYPGDTSYWLGYEYVPLCFSPPVFEDDVNGRLVAFRDGPLGMLELPLGVTPAQRAWRSVTLGTEGYFPEDRSSVQGSTVQANPYPFELMAPEMIRLLTQSDPASHTGFVGTGGQTATEKIVQNLWWPYRVLVDPATARVRLLTNRGTVWEFTSEPIHGLGDSCSTDLDCASGACGTEGVCCDQGMSCTQNMCMTCKGATPGVCGPALAGQPDPTGRCGSGACAGFCAGGGSRSCSYDPTRSCGGASSCSTGMLTPGGHCAPDQATCITAGSGLSTCPVTNGVPDLTAECVLSAQPCPSGHACADAVSCKTGCATRVDCATSSNDCNAQTGVCAPDMASQLATQQGVTPASIAPPRRLSNAEIAALLRDAGYPSDDAGRFAAQGNNDTNTAVEFEFDPNYITPATTYKNCLEYVETCMALNNTIDGCVALAPRCVTSTPWNGDPAGIECCPQTCLIDYWNDRATDSAIGALQIMAKSTCYLGGSDAGADGSADGGNQ